MKFYGDDVSLNELLLIIFGLGLWWIIVIVLIPVQKVIDLYWSFRGAKND